MPPKSISSNPLPKAKIPGKKPVRVVPPAPEIETITSRYDAIIAKKTSHKRKQDDLEAEKKALELEKVKDEKEEIQFYHDVLDNVLGSMMDLIKESPSAVDENVLKGLKAKIENAGEVVEKALDIKIPKVQDVQRALPHSLNLLDWSIPVKKVNNAEWEDELLLEYSD